MLLLSITCCFTPTAREGDTRGARAQKPKHCQHETLTPCATQHLYDQLQSMKASKGTNTKLKPFIYSKMLFNEEIEDLLCKIQGLSGFVFLASLLLNILISSMGIKTHCKGFADLFQYFREQPLLEVAVIGGSAIIHVMTSVVRLVRRKHLQKVSKINCANPCERDNECQMDHLLKSSVNPHNVHRVTGYVLMIILAVAVVIEKPNPDGVDSSTFLFRYLLPSLIFTFAGLYHYTFGLIKVFRFVSNELPKSHMATLLGIAATLGFLILFRRLVGYSLFEHGTPFYSTGRS